MKKRTTILLLALSAAAALSGCKKTPKETEPATTEAVTEAPTETETQTQKPTETEKEDSMNKTRKLKGLVKASDTSSLTIQTERGKELKFSISGADIQLANGIQTGSNVTILYKGKISGEDTSGAKVLMVLDLDVNETPVTEGEPMTEGLEADPDAGAGNISGTIEDVNTERLVIVADDGESYYFSLYGTYMNLVNGMQSGNYVTIDYTGDIYGPDLVAATQVTDNDNKAASSGPSSDGTYSYVNGTVQDCGMTTTTIVSDDGTELSFDTTNAQLCYNNGVAVGNYITVEYSGELNGSDTTGVKVAAVYDYADNAASGGTDGTADSAGDTSDGAEGAENTDDQADFGDELTVGDENADAQADADAGTTDGQ